MNMKFNIFLPYPNFIKFSMKYCELIRVKSNKNKETNKKATLKNFCSL